MHHAANVLYYSCTVPVLHYYSCTGSITNFTSAKADESTLVGSGEPRAQNLVCVGGAASDVGRIFDVENFQYGFRYIVPGTEYRVLNLVF
jgi:hypothetical protein